MHFCHSAPAGPLSPAPFSASDASRKGRATPRCSCPHLCAPRGSRPSPRLPRPPRDPAPSPPPYPKGPRPPRDSSSSPRLPRDPAPAPPPAVLCLRQLGTAEAPSPARPSFVDNKLGFHREAQSPPPPSRSPSAGLPSGWSRALSTSPSPLRIAAEGPLFLRPVPLIAITSPFLDSAVNFRPVFFFSFSP